VGVISLAALKARLDGALGSLSCWEAALPMAGGWNWWALRLFPTQARYSVILMAVQLLPSAYCCDVSISPVPAACHGVHSSFSFFAMNIMIKQVNFKLFFALRTHTKKLCCRHSGNYFFQESSG